jgi:hypothetical protein
MPLPLTVEYGDKRDAHALIYANGPETHVKVALEREPKRVLLDSDMWVLSTGVSESKK